jgi:hypothetical protein
MSAAAVIASGFASSVGSFAAEAVTVAALTVLGVFTLIAACSFLPRNLGRKKPPGRPAGPERDEEAERRACPWCDTHDCLDSTMCNCDEPCGSWICVVKEASL